MMTILHAKFVNITADLRSWKLVLYGTDVDPLNPGSAVPPPRPAQTSIPIETTGATPYNTTHGAGAPIPLPLIPQGNLSEFHLLLRFNLI